MHEFPPESSSACAVVAVSAEGIIFRGRNKERDGELDDQEKELPGEGNENGVEKRGDGPLIPRAVSQKDGDGC